MATQFKNISEVLKHAKCAFCEGPLKINADATSGYYEKKDNNLVAIDEVDGKTLFAVDCITGITKFYNPEIKKRLEVFVVEFICHKDNYLQIYCCQFNKSKYDVVVSKILMDEESVLLYGETKSYWVHNMFDMYSEPRTEIWSWDHDEGPPPKSHFELDIQGDLNATFKVNTEWLKINQNKEKFLEKVENLITFG